MEFQPKFFSETVISDFSIMAEYVTSYGNTFQRFLKGLFSIFIHQGYIRKVFNSQKILMDWDLFLIQWHLIPVVTDDRTQKLGL